jgi:hypothetical protein
MEILLGTIVGFVVTTLGAYLAFRVSRKFNDLESITSNEVDNLYRALEHSISVQEQTNNQIYTQFDNERRELDSRLDKLENRLTQKLK